MWEKKWSPLENPHVLRLPSDAFVDVLAAFGHPSRFLLESTAELGQLHEEAAMAGAMAAELWRDGRDFW